MAHSDGRILTAKPDSNPNPLYTSGQGVAVGNDIWAAEHGDAFAFVIYDEDMSLDDILQCIGKLKERIAASRGDTGL